jgi:hypothetical protein
MRSNHLTTKDYRAIVSFDESKVPFGNFQGQTGARIWQASTPSYLLHSTYEQNSTPTICHCTSSAPT